MISLLLTDVDLFTYCHTRKWVVNYATHYKIVD